MEQDRLLTYGKVQELTGIKSRTTIYEKVQRGEFPAPLRLGKYFVRFKESEILAWIEALPRQHY